MKTCTRCGKAKKGSSSPTCVACDKEIRQAAVEWQEKDYLVRWLHGRVDRDGQLITDSAVTATAADRRCVMRLLTKARALGVDWTRPPEAMTFDKRLAILTQRPQPKVRKRSKAAA